MYKWKRALRKHSNITVIATAQPRLMLPSNSLSSAGLLLLPQPARLSAREYSSIAREITKLLSPHHYCFQALAIEAFSITESPKL